MTPLAKSRADLGRWSRPLGGDRSESRHCENASHLAHNIFGSYLPVTSFKRKSQRIFAMLVKNLLSKPDIPRIKIFNLIVK
jgi:hypothetical protein